MDELKKRIIDFPKLVSPAPAVLSGLDMSARTYPLSSVRVLKIDGDRFCKWCHSGDPLNHHARTYCGEDCKTSANMFCYPQDYLSKAFTLIERQQCACALCGLSYEDRIIRYMDRREATKTSRFNPKCNIIFLFTIGYHLSQRQDIEMDHTIPIHRGGVGLGLDNIQAVCSICHKDKTFAERKR